MVIFANGKPYSAVCGACAIEIVGGFPNEV